MKINQILTESTGATVAFAFGRFNPAHQGHIEVWRTVEQAGKNWFVGTNPNTIGPNDPLTFEQKSAWMTEIYPPIAGHIVAQTTVLSLAAFIFNKLRKNERATIAYITDETDWAWSGKLLNQYNGVEGSHGYYKFAEIIHVPSPRVSSATALRDAARADDKVAFYHASGTDPKLKVAGLTYFDTVKQACEKYPLPVKKAKKLKEPVVAENINLKEDSRDVESLKALLASKIKQLPADADTQRALQEIEELLSYVNAGGRMGMVQGELAKIDDPSVKAAQKLLAKYILALPATAAQRKEMFNMWQEDVLVNVEALLSVGKHSINDFIMGYNSNPAIKELTDDLFGIAALGQGKGEFALSVMSKRINKRSQTEGGDLLIDNKKVEVKTKDLGAARFYDQNVRPSQQWPAAVENFKTKYAEVIQGLGISATTGLSLGDLTRIAVSIPEKQNEIRKDIKSVIANIFPGMNVDNIVDFTVAGDTNSAKSSYANVNFNFYMNQKDDDGVLYINLAPGKNSQSWTVYYRNAAELAKAGLRLHASTAYPVGKDPRMAYPQMSVVDTTQQQTTESISKNQKTVAKTWDQMTPKEKISGVKGRTVWNEKTRKYYTVFDVPAKQETTEASLATMRDYFAGDENARDPYEITKQRLHFAKDANAKANMQKRFRSPAEYELWLKQNKLRQISGVKEDEEAGEVKQQGQLIPFPAGTTKVHVSDVYDWYKLGQVISDLDDADPTKFGQGAPQSIIAFGSEEEESKLMPLLKRLGLKIDDIDPEGTDEIGEAYHAGSLYEMLKKERTKNWALTNKRKR